jgi:hypothetical protein
MVDHVGVTDEQVRRPAAAAAAMLCIALTQARRWSG